MAKQYVSKTEMVLDHFNGLPITRPDSRSKRKYDFDFCKLGDTCWRYLNSSDDISAFDEQVKISTETIGAKYRILISATGEIVKTNVVI